MLILRKSGLILRKSGLICCIKYPNRSMTQANYEQSFLCLLYNILILNPLWCFILFLPYYILLITYTLHINETKLLVSHSSKNTVNQTPAFASGSIWLELFPVTFPASDELRIFGSKDWIVTSGNWLRQEVQLRGNSAVRRQDTGQETFLISRAAFPHGQSSRGHKPLVGRARGKRRQNGRWDSYLSRTGYIQS